MCRILGLRVPGFGGLGLVFQGLGVLGSGFWGLGLKVPLLEAQDSERLGFSVMGLEPTTTWQDVKHSSSRKPCG